MITKKGTVTSAKLQGTITVTVHQHVTHPLYKKSFRKSKKFLVDTKKSGEKDIVIGDEVLIAECRPLSKRKHFELVTVTKRVPRVSEIGEEAGLQEAMHRTKRSSESSGSSESSTSSSL